LQSASGFWRIDMTLYWIAGLVVLGLFIYLVFALLKPEKFG
jgi:K+-transporting ATPase KdpF subunit